MDGVPSRRSHDAADVARSGEVPSTSFTILVPAHDEELLVADTVDHLMALDYPRELFDVHVVADHCGDATAEIARDHGATVLENVDPDVRGKGPALALGVRSPRLGGRDP